MNDSDKLVKKIYEQIISKEEGVSEPEFFYNIEGDYVATYAQNGRRYILTIQEIFNNEDWED